MQQAIDFLRPARATDDPAIRGSGQIERGREFPPAGEAEATQELIAIHLGLMKEHPGFRGPHRRAQGCVAALFHVRDDIPQHLRIGIFQETRSYGSLVRYSSGGSDDDRKPDAHAMSIKVVDVEGKKLLTAEETAKTQDFIVCDNPVFVVRDVREMVDFENAKAERQRFSGENAEFAMQYPRQDALLTRFARSGFLKYAKGTPFAAEYWSQTPSAYGEGLAVKYFVRPWPQNDLALRPRDNANFLQEAMRDRLVTRKAPAYFDFCIECQTDPLLMPVEDPMVRWLPGGGNTIPVATIEILPAPFESPEQARYCEALSYNPWHGLPAHRPLGGVNRARRAVYLAASHARHQVTQQPAREPTEADIQRLWGAPQIRS